MRNGQQTIIIKKAVKRDHGHGGGGAWKVAFADFTLAMMAFFMVLWIISSAPTSELETAAKKLRDYSIFDGSPNPFKFEGRGTPMDLEVNTSLETTTSSMLSGASSDPSFQDMIKTLGGESAPLTAAKEKIENLAKKLGAEDNISVEIIPQGLRIRLNDDDERQMFQSGNSNMSPFFEDLLLAIAPIFEEVENKMIISGHTDSVPFSRAGYTNWELSGDRAMTARQVLRIGGAPDERVLQVSGMSDRAPVRPEDPRHSLNRRIELMLLTKKAERDLMAIFDGGVGRERGGEFVDNARKSALSNQPVTR